MLMEYVQRGGPVMYPLLACSVVALTVVTERLVFWMRLRRRREPERVERFLQTVQQGDYAQAYEVGRSSLDPVLQVLVRGLVDRNLSPRLSMELKAKELLGQMGRYLGVLDTAITVAPLLGIYGTITGIIRAFGFLGASGVPDPRLVAAGIAEALITTAAGLTIALAVIPLYNHFLRRIERAAQEIEQRATAVELILASRRHIEQTEPAFTEPTR